MFAALHRSKLFCSRECKAASHRERERNKRNIKSYHPPVEPWRSSKKRQIETDADQARIKRELDERHGICNGPVRKIKKGSREWNEIVKTLTPPQKIRNVTSHYGYLGAYQQGRG